MFQKEAVLVFTHGVFFFTRKAAGCFFLFASENKKTTRAKGSTKPRPRPGRVSFAILMFLFFVGFLVTYCTLGLKAFWARPRPTFRPKPRPRPRHRPVLQGQAQA
jgi:ABC-type Fe3+ transport system permease subunit